MPTQVAERVEVALGLLLRRGTRAGLYTALVDGLNGVDETTYPVLSGIARLGAVSSSRLAGEIGIDRTATTRYAGRLEAAGLVARAPDPDDARATLLSLTPAGRAAIGAARERLVSRLDAMLDEWDAGERAVFAEIFECLVGTLRG